jgi:hypothetical protein
MKPYLKLIVSLLILLGAVAVRAQDSQESDTRKSAKKERAVNNLYIVQMSEAPAANYEGDIPGLRGTKPARGQKLRRGDPDVDAYAQHLDQHHDRTVRAAGGRKVYDYRYTFNGFAAELTPTEAEALKKAPGVVSVVKDEVQYADTSTTPHFLGLDQEETGLWDRLGGVKRAGENIIIGMVDSGIWPEGKSFAGRGRDGSAEGDEEENRGNFEWRGQCEAGEQFPASTCNTKLIGARWFDGAWCDPTVTGSVCDGGSHSGDAALKALRPWEFLSARDYNGHGSHTSSTAGGNHGVSPTGAATVFGPISGMAPRARLAMYKALWSTQDASTAVGFTSDLVAAIDEAVADGVDVINYSISGTLTNFLNPAEIAFLNAANAGVFVVASAGNSGPTSGTVAHPSPWITTVAAGTHNRNMQGTATLGATTFTGASVSPSVVGPAPLIDATAAGLSGADPTAVRLCFAAIDNPTGPNNVPTPVLDPAKVTGKIVVCDRGGNARVNKSLAVQQAGGVGMILVNVTPNSLNADFHFVPTVHLPDTDRAAVKAYAMTVGPTATISKAQVLLNAPAPFTAAFSSRGPLLAGSGNLLKPDVIAPGQDILAAVAPPGNNGQLFNIYSGTSMSSPHVAGVAALLKNLRPDWTPMMIKSALMTSAGDVLDGPNTNASVIFRQGAGHIAPNNAADPGLVYDSNVKDWLAFLCGTTTGVNPATCNALSRDGYSLDPSDFNGASVAIGAMAGIQTVKRRVTNVGERRATYTAGVAGMTGFDVSVSPSSLTLRPGQTKSFDVTFTRTTATLNGYTGGQLTWSDGTHNVRSPLAVQPVALAAPAQVFGAGGAISYNVKFGYGGAFAASARGVIPATTTNSSVNQDPAQSFAPNGAGVTAFAVTIAAGTTYARFALFDANVTPASDLDLYVFNGATLVGASQGPTAIEEVDLTNPAPGSDYVVYVHGFNVPGGTATFTFFSWLLGSANAGNVTISAPATAVTGGGGAVQLNFNGLAAGTKYLGSVAYSGSVSPFPNPTIVRVDTP